jgi:hypothetical protein
VRIRRRLVEMRVSHFQSLYKELVRENIAEILKLTSFFPSFVSDEANALLIEEVTKEEMKVVQTSMQKDKSPGLDEGL